MKIIELNNIICIIKKKNIYFKEKYFAFIKKPNDIFVEKKNNLLFIFSINKHIKEINSFYKQILNILIGIKIMWVKILEIKGTGYKITNINNILTINLGYTNLIEIILPFYIKIIINKNNFELHSTYKDKLGLFANTLIKLKKYNPYKKKGIYFQNNFFIKKSTKKKQ